MWKTEKKERKVRPLFKERKFHQSMNSSRQGAVGPSYSRPAIVLTLVSNNSRLPTMQNTLYPL